METAINTWIPPFPDPSNNKQIRRSPVPKRNSKKFHMISNIYCVDSLIVDLRRGGRRGRDRLVVRFTTTCDNQRLSPLTL